jgi:hypothetical protein
MLKPEFEIVFIEPSTVDFSPFTDASASYN